MTAAAATVMLLGLRINIGQGMTPGYLLAFALIPLWLPALGKFRWATPLTVAGILAILSGAWLTAFASIDHDISTKNLVSDSLMVLGIMAGVGVILWARQFMPIHILGLLFSLGLLATIFAGELRFSANPWKYAYSVPVTIIVLSLVRFMKNRFMEILALLILGTVSALNDSRSFFAIIALTAILLVWQYLPASRRNGVYKTLLAFGAIAVITYNAGATLVVDGYLGAGAQARSVEQIQTSGSLLVGGRPELTAALALLQDRPYGFGTGVLASPADVLTAKAGMVAINYEPNNGYVEKYMFGERIELHSVLGDLWAPFGIPGLIAGLAILVLLLRVIATLVAHRTGSGLELFLVILTLWNLLFSPLYSSAPTLLLTLGLVLLSKPGAEARGNLGAAYIKLRGKAAWQGV
ncbi:hypothetical protein [Arthrobacter oryzae]|uniref:hypothetical protein n=1 Tax=Arthrobacter oryzae TaxID=409290 RepID=UPI00278A6AFC|nr:hypothetical protein [Arthrobacter oryzae]MDQ0078997.1 putative membrane protein [Arthrobacter oryzae]